MIIPKQRVRSFFAIAAYLLTLVPHVAAQDTAALQERLRQAAISNSLDTPDMKPWHLVLEVQLLDAQGHPTQTGTIEEWWISSELNKIVYTSGSSVWMEIRNGESLFRTSADAPPWLVEQLRRQVVHPMPLLKAIDAPSLFTEKKQLGAVPLDCIAGENATNHPVITASNKIFCLEHDKVVLRATSKFDGMISTSRVDIGTFLGKSVAINQGISMNRVYVAEGHVSKLKVEPLTETDFTPEIDMMRVDTVPVSPDGSFAKDNMVRKVPPQYPEGAKRDHIAGTVILSIVIGIDGRVRSIKPIYSPRADLTSASIAAVSQWIYKPYLVNGQAREVDTEVTANFSFGRLY